MKKRILSLILAILVVFGTIPPITVSAANNMQSNPSGGTTTGGTVPNYVSSETMWKGASHKRESLKGFIFLP